MRAARFVVPLLLLMLFFLGCSSSPLDPQMNGIADDWSDWPSDFESVIDEFREAQADNNPVPGDPIPIPSINLIAWTRVLPPTSWDSSAKPNPEIGIMKPDGSKKWRLTYWKGVDDHASWANVIKGISWQSDRAPDPSSSKQTMDIFKRTIFGPGVERLTFELDNFNPDWDKGRIAWVKDIPSSSPAIKTNRIYHMKADGTEIQGPFGLFGTLHSDPMWRPNGKQIAFSAKSIPSWPGPPPRWDIYIMDADGGNIINLTKNLEPPNDANVPVIFTEPAFSRDGNKLAFASNFKGNWDLYYWDFTANTAMPFRITFNNAVDRHPSWSPCGMWIVFSSNRRDSNFEIYKMKVPHPGDPFICKPVRLTWSPHPDVNPDWSPKMFNVIPYPGPKDPEPGP